ncbi:MAG: hypothetical protein H6842_05485 [Rhodospirillaceae bacterium]|nr:hypothetical protein [Rhodospirillaceae bacterium]
MIDTSNDAGAKRDGESTFHHHQLAYQQAQDVFIGFLYAGGISATLGFFLVQSPNPEVKSFFLIAVFFLHLGIDWFGHARITFQFGQVFPLVNLVIKFVSEIAIAFFIVSGMFKMVQVNIGASPDFQDSSALIIAFLYSAFALFTLIWNINTVHVLADVKWIDVLFLSLLGNSPLDINNLSRRLTDRSVRKLDRIQRDIDDSFVSQWRPLQNRLAEVRRQRDFFLLVPVAIWLVVRVTLSWLFQRLIAVPTQKGKAAAFILLTNLLGLHLFVLNFSISVVFFLFLYRESGLPITVLPLEDISIQLIGIIVTSLYVILLLPWKLMIFIFNMILLFVLVWLYASLSLETLVYAMMAQQMIVSILFLLLTREPRPTTSG